MATRLEEVGDKMNKATLAHALEMKIIECWSVTDDIKVVYEELLDSLEVMDEEELGNILIGIATLYNRKFERLWAVFDDVCDHGGIWLDEELVTVAKQHKDYSDKLDYMFDYEFPTKEDIRASINKMADGLPVDNHISEPPDECNSETKEDN